MPQIKKFAKFLWNEFVYGGHLLSLGAVSIVFTSAILLDIKITWDCLAIVYLAIYSAYLYNRFEEIEKDFLTNTERTVHIRKYYKKIPLIIVCSVATLIGLLLYFGNTKILFFSIFLLSMGFLYSIFFKKITKKIIGFKNFFVALMWASLILFLAFYYLYDISNLSLSLLFIFVFLRCFMGTSLYDVKDIEIDKKENLLNLSIILKQKTLFPLLNLINILSLLPILIGIYFNLFPFFSITLFFIILIAFYSLKIIKNKEKNIAYLSEILLGTEKIFWSFFILLGKFSL
jgi:4-hydroxybenzoate polyprenyltransferase